MKKASLILIGIILLVVLLAYLNFHKSIMPMFEQRELSIPTVSFSSQIESGLIEKKEVVVINETIISEINEQALRIITTTNTEPPKAAHFLAVLHIAVSEALNSIDQKYTNYLDITLPENTEHAAQEELAQGAAYAVIANYFPEFSDIVLGTHRQKQKNNDDDDPVDSYLFGAQIGELVARHISEKNSSQLITAEKNIEEITYTPGAWKTTPPYFEAPMLPQWGETAYFARSSAEHYPPYPADISSQTYADEFNEVKQIGSRDSMMRTTEQSEIARFWADGKNTFTPPGHWNFIAQQIIKQKKLSLNQEAHIFALLNIALSDTGVTTWKSKYDYNYWRPVDAIHYADADNNPETTRDTDWQSYIEIPNFPEYPSGHSAFSSAAATILISFFGDNNSFSSYSNGLPGVTRNFTTISEAAREAGMSRIYGGIHFQSANREGARLGKNIAQAVVLDFSHSTQ